MVTYIPPSSFGGNLRAAPLAALFFCVGARTLSAGRPEQTHHRQPRRGVIPNPRQRPGRLVPEIQLPVGDTVDPQEIPQFIFKPAHPLMLRLVVDLADQSGELGLPEREGTLTGLLRDRLPSLDDLLIASYTTSWDTIP